MPNFLIESSLCKNLRNFCAKVGINEQRHTPGLTVWQRNYYEHIIRDEQSYENIAAYILNNPRQWEADELF